MNENLEDQFIITQALNDKLGSEVTDMKSDMKKRDSEYKI